MTGYTIDQLESVEPLLLLGSDGVNTGSVSLDEMLDKIWDKLYKRPVIVQCGYCHCHNAFSNVACVQCGAPMGEYKNV